MSQLVLGGMTNHTSLLGIGYHYENTVEPPTTDQDSSYYGNLHNADKKVTVPNHFLYFTVHTCSDLYSGNLPTPNYGHRIIL